MDALTVIAAIGGIALLAGIFGGVTAKDITIPSLPITIRIISAITGLTLIGIVVGIVVVPQVLKTATSSSTATLSSTNIVSVATNASVVSTATPAFTSTATPLPPTATLAPTSTPPAATIAPSPTAKPLPLPTAVQIPIATSVTSSGLVTTAWDMFGKGQFDVAIQYAQKCVDLFKDEAIKQQNALPAAPLIGPATDAQKNTIFANWALNDVGTSYFIMGEAWSKLGKTSEAQKAYDEAKKLPYARAWDSSQGGFFWSPAGK